MSEQRNAPLVAGRAATRCRRRRVTPPSTFSDRYENLTFLKSKLSGFDSLNYGDGLKIHEHRRVAGEERNKTPMGLGQEVAGIRKWFWVGWKREAPIVDFQWFSASGVTGFRSAGGRRGDLGGRSCQWGSGTAARLRPVGGGRVFFEIL
ncbi:hypothetical protein M0R45_032044 [Rubus argutus]|uniref:Uncharacterized protein n=1 Tax=Rubus argutus TaxID=59490 RepID=A0AAW1WGL5_RUBAR